MELSNFKLEKPLFYNSKIGIHLELAQRACLFGKVMI
ncbi:MAG: hypothetical protein ACI8Y3_000962 [Paraglaciecola sp.]|jgi:hypothetical protein